MTIDDAARMIKYTGWGLLLAKVDIKNAYCNISVHPEEVELCWVCSGREPYM